MKNINNNLNNDILDEDFVKIFKPLYRVQNTLGCLGISVRQKIADNPTLHQKFYAIIIILLSSFCLIYSIMFDDFLNVTIRLTIPINYYFIVIQYCSCYFIYLSIVFNKIFLSGNSFRNILVSLQSIDRILHLDKTRYKYIYFSKLILCSTILTIIAYFIFFIIRCFLSGWSLSIYLSLLIYYCCISILMFEIIHYVFLILFINSRIQYLNIVLKCTIKSTFYIENVNKLDNLKCRLKKIFMAYKIILDTCELKKKTFSYFVSI